MPTYKDINLLTQKSALGGTEKLPVSDTEYITPDQIIGGVNNVNAVLYDYEIGKALASAGTTYDDADYCASGFIEVSQYTTLKFVVSSSPAGSSVRIVEYNGQKVRVDAWGYNYNNREFNRGANTKYIRLSYFKTESAPHIYADTTKVIWGIPDINLDTRVTALEESIGDIATILASI